MRSTEMLGRADELSRLLSAIGRAREGQVNVVLVAGEAGIGKSRLVEEMTSRLDDDAVVAVGHGVEMESGELPFGVVAETLRSLVLRLGPTAVQELLGEDGASALAPLVPELGDHPGGDRVAMVSACLRLFESLARDHLVCWVVEDLQWADAPTRDIVGLLCRTVPSGRLLVVCTVRTDDPRGDSPTGVGLEPSVLELVRLPNADLLGLDRLEPALVRELANNIVDGGLSRAQVERIAALSDGVPLLVEELAVGGRADAFTVEALTGGRLDLLGSAGRQLVEAAAIGEGYLEGSLVEEVLGLAPDEFDAALQEVVTAGILEESSLHGRLRFRHALVRESVDDRIPPGLRRSWHARWADVLERNADKSLGGPVVFAVAHHRYDAGDDEAAFDSLVAAAMVARRTGVVSEEHTVLVRLLGLWGSVDDAPSRVGASHRDVLYWAVWSCIWSEGFRVAAQVIEQTLLPSTHDPVERAWLQLRLAAGRNESGPLESSELTEDEIEGYVELLSASPADRMVVDGLRALLAVTAIESDLWQRLYERAERGAREVGDELLQLSCRLAASQRLVWLGRPDAAADALDRELAKTWNVPPHRLCGPDGSLIWFLAIQGKYEEAERAGRRALARMADPRPVAAIWEHVVENVVWVWRMTGRWDDAEKLLASTRSYWGDGLLMVDLHADVLQLVRTGRVTRAEAWLALLQSDEPRQLHDVVLLEHCALLVAAEGDLDSARALYRRLWGLPDPRRATDDLFAPVVRAARMEADARASGRRRVDGDARGFEDVNADAHLQQVLEIAAQLHAYGDLGTAWRADVAAQRARFYAEDTRDLFEKAAEAWEDVGHPYDAALCRLRLAEAHLQRGDRTAAAEQLRVVTRVAASLGAQPLRAQANALSRRAGIRREGGPSSQVGLLTSREQEVLTLLADGHSNLRIAADLYVSPKTVSVHVSRILAKLDATNRTEAVAIARREGLIDP